ncbi:hypothetical protein [Lysinibacillus sp. NPDC086135]|uniref:hypothetical protein n=1 Tax=Lysinibacillus sp. NPDC086135 TaxID=3364130 RepID=UPI0038232452
MTKQMNALTDQDMFVKLEVGVFVKGMSPFDLQTFYSGLIHKINIETYKGRKINPEVLDSEITSIVVIDDDENEREFIDKGGKLKLTEQEIQEAIKKKIH